MPKVTEVEVKEAIRKILEDKKAYRTSLNYAVNYCVAALSQSGHELAVQCLYILNNISRWRNPEAKRVREVLKAFSKGL
jgi:ribosomal protein L1